MCTTTICYIVHELSWITQSIMLKQCSPTTVSVHIRAELICWNRVCCHYLVMHQPNTQPICMIWTLTTHHTTYTISQSAGVFWPWAYTHIYIHKLIRRSSSDQLKWLMFEDDCAWISKLVTGVWAVAKWIWMWIRDIVDWLAIPIS